MLIVYFVFFFFIFISSFFGPFHVCISVRSLARSLAHSCITAEWIVLSNGLACIHIQIIIAYLLLSFGYWPQLVSKNDSCFACSWKNLYSFYCGFICGCSVSGLSLDSWKRNCSFLYESVFFLFCYEFKEFSKKE